MKSCPQCALLLEQVTWENAALWACRSCGGCWFMAADFERLTPVLARLGELDADFPGVASTGMYEGLRLICPDCRTLYLERETLPTSPQSQALTCSRCRGVWLKAGERAAIAAAAPPIPAPIPESVSPIETAVPPEPPPEVVSPPVEMPVSVQSPQASAPQPPTPPPAPARQEAAVAPPEPERASAQPPAAPPVEPEPPVSTPDQALQRLREGNRRFVEGKTVHPRQNPMRRAEIAQAQEPYAAVVSCSDSRVPPEILFDQGLGDLFVIREAGHAMDALSVGNVEYAVERFGVMVVMVLGHAQCSAVRAAVEGTAVHPYLNRLLSIIQPSVESARPMPGNLLDNAIRAHIRHTVQRLARQETLATRLRDGKLKLAGAYYDLDSGRVDIFTEISAPIPEETLPSATSVLSTTAETAPAAQEEAQLIKPEEMLRALISDAPTAETLLMLLDAGSWCCPRCMAVYEESGRCVRCHVALVRPDATAACPVCQVSNSFANVRCRTCGAPMRTGQVLDRLYPRLDKTATAPPVAAPSGAPPIAASSQRKPALLPFPRRCPQCRRGYPERINYCTFCGVSLVQSSYQVFCSGCHQINPIAAASCSSCHSDLHPNGVHELVVSRRTITRHEFWNTPSPSRRDRASNSCSSSVLSALLLCGLLGYLIVYALQSALSQ
jgi:carbonic anhydrase